MANDRAKFHPVDGTVALLAVDTNGELRNVVVGTDGKLAVTPTSNSAVNVAQVAGTTTDTNSGNKSAGTLRVVLATDQPTPTNALNVQVSNSFANVAANATTTHKTGAGVLHTLTINTKGVTSAVVIYDNTAGSGTKIATIDTTLDTVTLCFDCAFATGLTTVTTGGTPADITVTWR